MVVFNYQRRRLTLGMIDRSDALHYTANIEALISHRRKHPDSVPVALESWIRELPQKHREQLGEIGLLDRFNSSLTVEELIEAFLTEYDLRPEDEIRRSTKKQFRTCLAHRIPPKLKKAKIIDIVPRRKHAMIHSKPVFSESTKALFRTVEAWQREHYVRSSWSRANGRLREVGKWAIENGICEYNPFTLLKSPGETNEQRNLHVPREWVEDAILMCHDPDTRMCFVLGRYAGVRLPSEARTLKWSHVDFDRKQLRILDSKKREFRTMPLFDRIRQELEKMPREDGHRFVFSKRFLSGTDTNNYQLMREAIQRTEWEPWERLRQNLRTSCENDLLHAGFPERKVTTWLGHTVKVSRQHYQRMLDADYLIDAERAFRDE